MRILGKSTSFSLSHVPVADGVKPARFSAGIGDRSCAGTTTIVARFDRGGPATEGRVRQAMSFGASSSIRTSMQCIYIDDACFKYYLFLSMGKKRDGKEGSKKSSQLVIRVGREERDAFVALCDEMDTSAAREIRHFMRRFVAKHKKK
ncbi:MAG: hypothetical protein AAGE76_12155 [Pseudomonadota bacterium]